MKCSRCHALNAPDDVICSGCRMSLDPTRAAAATADAIANTPQWAYFFVALCGVLPLLTLGGAIPVMVGIGGAGSCLKVARVQSLPGVVRFFACVVITGIAWCVVGLLVLAVFAESAKRR